MNDQEPCYYEWNAFSSDLEPLPLSPVKLMAIDHPSHEPARSTLRLSNVTPVS
jgi:hypothetical protein